MQPTPLSQGMGAVTIALLFFSAVFGDPAFFVPGAVLLLFIGYRAVAFDRACYVLAGSIGVEREVDALITRQGRAVNVNTRVAIPQSPLSVRFRDEPPEASFVSAGTPEARGDCTLAYRITLSGHGRTAFSGISLLLQDPFFSRCLRLTGARFCTPEITVYPADAAVSGTAGLRGEKERGGAIGLRHQVVESFREFLPGDDPRHIDRKLSAKHGKPFVRQYSALTGSPAFVILDSPGRDAPVDPAAVSRLAAAAGSLIESSIRQYRVCSLLVIAGPNLIRFLPMEADQRALLQALENFPSAQGFRRFYRAQTPAAIAAHQGRVERDGDLFPAGSPEAALCRSLERCYGCFSSQGFLDSFRLQMLRAFLPFSETRIHLFSTFSGDTSHIDQVIAAAEERRLPLVVHVPREVPGIPRSFGGAEVQVV